MKMGSQDLPDHRDRGVLKAHVAESGRTVSPDHQDQQEHRVEEDRTERTEGRDNTGLKDRRDHRDLPGHPCMPQPLELGLEAAARKGRQMILTLPTETRQRLRRRPSKC